MNTLPLYFYPSVICFLDDNERFLKNNILGLDPKYKYQQFVEPEVAIAHLEKEKKCALDESKLIDELQAVEELDDQAHKFALAINLQPIVQQYFNNHRFTQTTVLVVDYAMPSMNGLEVCQQLASSPIKKIMVTGQADHRLAVEAFNQGLIDYFVLKDEVDFYEKLNNAIDRLHFSYFNDISKSLFSNLSQLENFCLPDDGVICFLLHYFQKEEIREAYLIDTSGSLLLINSLGERSIFAIKCLQEMYAMLEIARSQNAPKNIMDSLSDNSQMLLFLNEQDYFLPTADWSALMHPCVTMNQQGSHYFSVIKPKQSWLDSLNIHLR